MECMVDSGATDIGATISTVTASAPASAGGSSARVRFTMSGTAPRQNQRQGTRLPAINQRRAELDLERPRRSRGRFPHVERRARHGGLRLQSVGFSP